MSTTNILLFRSSPEESVWGQLQGFPMALREELMLLENGIVADTADRLAEKQSNRVVVHETKNRLVGGTNSVTCKVILRTQEASPLWTRIFEAVKELYEQDEKANVVVFYGRNPLYPPALLSRGVALLEQKDDVVVMGESKQRNRDPAVMWIATKRYHEELFGEKCSWWDCGTSLLQAIAKVRALLIPMRSVRNIVGLEDLSHLYHEIEREVLLKKWYPQRTYQVLTAMHRAGIISEI